MEAAATFFKEKTNVIKKDIFKDDNFVKPASKMLNGFVEATEMVSRQKEELNKIELPPQSNTVPK